MTDPSPDLPPELAALEAALAALPADSEAMVLSQLDGLIAGVIVCPVLIAPEDWLPLVWGDPDDAGAAMALFGDEAAVWAVTDLILAHYAEVAGVLSTSPDDYAPIYDVAPETDAVMWEGWVFGFEAALALRPAVWEAILDAADESPAREALGALFSLYDIAVEECDLAPEAVAELTEAAPDLIPALVTTLHAARDDLGAGARNTTPIRVSKTGRNDPCPCGSGQKYKKCCGAEG